MRDLLADPGKCGRLCPAKPPVHGRDAPCPRLRVASIPLLHRQTHRWICGGCRCPRPRQELTNSAPGRGFCALASPTLASSWGYEMCSRACCPGRPAGGLSPSPASHKGSGGIRANRLSKSIPAASSQVRYLPFSLYSY